MFLIITLTLDEAGRIMGTMQPLQDFLDWLVAVVKEWYYWLPSSAVGAAIGRGTDLGFWQPGKKTAWAIVLLGLGVSVFQAWRKQLAERRKAEQLASELRAKLEARRPKLSLTIETAIWLYDAQRDITIFIIAAGILNSGEPTVAQAWRAKYEIGASSEDMDAFHVTDTYVVTVGNDTLTLTNENMLIPQVLTKAIARGGGKLGRLVFAIPGNRQHQIATHQFKIRVVCHDFEYSPTEAVFAPDSKPLSSVKIYPGEQLEQKNAVPASGKI